MSAKVQLPQPLPKSSLETLVKEHAPNGLPAKNWAACAVAFLDAAIQLNEQGTHQSKSILDLATERDTLRAELSELARLLSMTEISETAGMWSASIKNIRGEFVLEVQSEMMEEPEVSKFTDIFDAIRAMHRQLT